MEPANPFTAYHQIFGQSTTHKSNAGAAKRSTLCIKTLDKADVQQ